MLYILDVTIHIVGKWSHWFSHTALASLQVPGGIGKRKTNLLNHEKSLMFKYGRTQRKIPSRLVCGSHGTCLDCTLFGVHFFCVQIIQFVKIMTPCYTGCGLLAGAWWDSEREKTCIPSIYLYSYRYQRSPFSSSVSQSGKEIKKYFCYKILTAITFA